MVPVLSHLPEDIEDLKKQAKIGSNSAGDLDIISGSSTQVSIAI